MVRLGLVVTLLALLSCWSSTEALPIGSRYEPIADRFWLQSLNDGYNWRKLERKGINYKEIAAKVIVPRL